MKAIIRLVINLEVSSELFTTFDSSIKFRQNEKEFNYYKGHSSSLNCRVVPSFPSVLNISEPNRFKIEENNFLYVDMTRASSSL